MVGAFFVNGEICAFLCPFLRKEVSTVANRIMGITVKIGKDTTKLQTGPGSYDNATEAQRDILRTGADGKATSKDLPYGNYVIHQISGVPNCTFMEDMEVSISENAKTYEVSATDIQKLNKLRLYKKGEVLSLIHI